MYFYLFFFLRDILSQKLAYIHVMPRSWVYFLVPNHVMFYNLEIFIRGKKGWASPNYKKYSLIPLENNCFKLVRGSQI